MPLTHRDTHLQIGLKTLGKRFELGAYSGLFAMEWAKKQPAQRAMI